MGLTCSNFRSPQIFDKDRNYKLTGKVVLVTGANCGIGFATANELAKRVCNIANIWPSTFDDKNFLGSSRRFTLQRCDKNELGKGENY